MAQRVVALGMGFSFKSHQPLLVGLLVVAVVGCTRRNVEGAAVGGQKQVNAAAVSPPTSKEPLPQPPERLGNGAVDAMVPPGPSAAPRGGEPTLTLEEPGAVLTVLQTSRCRQWAIVSRMSAEPEQAKGVSEEKFLLHVPSGQRLKHPRLGWTAHLIGFEDGPRGERVSWATDGGDSVMDLSNVAERCLRPERPCGIDSSRELEAPTNVGTATERQRFPWSLEGWLRPGISSSMVEAKLGKGASKGEPTVWAATGTSVREWRYPALGLRLQMERDTAQGAERVLSAEVVTFSAMQLGEGIGVGSTLPELRRSYEGRIDDSSTDERVVVGRPYEGVVFFLDGGVVRRLFLGSGSE